MVTLFPLLIGEFTKSIFNSFQQETENRTIFGTVSLFSERFAIDNGLWGCVAYPHFQQKIKEKPLFSEKYVVFCICLKLKVSCTTRCTEILTNMFGFCKNKTQILVIFKISKKWFYEEQLCLEWFNFESQESICGQSMVFENLAIERGPNLF